MYAFNTQPMIITLWAEDASSLNTFPSSPFCGHSALEYVRSRLPGCLSGEPGDRRRLFLPVTELSPGDLKAV